MYSKYIHSQFGDSTFYIYYIFINGSDMYMYIQYTNFEFRDTTLKVNVQKKKKKNGNRRCVSDEEKDRKERGET